MQPGKPIKFNLLQVTQDSPMSYVTTDTVIKEAKKKGIDKKPTLEHILVFAQENPDLQLKSPVVFLHEPINGLVSTLGCVITSDTKPVWYMNSPDGNWIINYPNMNKALNWIFAFPA